MKLYIANRGEIACRIQKTAKKMGIETLVGYSEADADALWVEDADATFLLGPGPAPESYLNTDRIIEILKQEKPDLLHPGYGFLSENHDFAQAVIDLGIRWIGPSPEAILSMGDKEKARHRMAEAGVPLVPGVDQIETAQEAAKAAASIGYPVLLKAAKGGGGIGMRAVESEDEIEAAFEETQTRALRAFGDGRVFVEKLIVGPHHVEVQVFGTESGAATLFQRECSVQRRHQKVIEEAPSPFANKEAVEALNQAAKSGADAIHYMNAGTMEFLLSAEQKPYFLEMNTRLQVEHPVTELITGLDLVELQIKTALGENVAPAFEGLVCNGHAIECRLYAENPKNFYPSPGTIESLEWPSGEGIRIDTGFRAGDTITPFYDPMIAKIISHGATREEALARMKKALEELKIEGLRTNHPFLLELMENEDFVRGQYDTSILYQLRPKLRGKA